MLLLACKAFDAGLLEPQQRDGVSAGPKLEPDAGRPVVDAGSDCVANASVERCNGKDDDCDGRLDEGAEADCAADHALGACVPGGTCVLAACDEGYADCNGAIEDGCEKLRADVPCGTCGRRCPDKKPEVDGGGIVDDEDAGMIEPPPMCVPKDEICNDTDDDCDDWIDESGACALQMCTASTPTYRGESCDACACERCAQLVADCQNHPDPMWASRCRALVECYVVHDARGECGTDGDCYRSNTGPCAAEVNLAAGATNPNDPTRAATGCAAGTPPVAPCAAAVNYRDQCSLGTCSGPCG